MDFQHQPLSLFENTLESNQIDGCPNSFGRRALRKSHSEPLQPILGVSPQTLRQDSITSMVRALSGKGFTFTIQDLLDCLDNISLCNSNGSNNEDGAKPEDSHLSIVFSLVVTFEQNP